MAAVKRGAYRSIPVVLWHGRDFQRLPSAARLVFLALKCSLGPSGIDRFPGMLAALAEMTGYDEAMVSRQLAILETFRDAETGEADPWIQREHNVAWVVRHLEFEPSIRLDNKNHRDSLMEHIRGLPRVTIVQRFRHRYGEWFVDDPQVVQPLSGWGEIPPTPPANGMGDAMGDGMGDAMPITETETEDRTKGAGAPRSGGSEQTDGPPAKRRSSGREKGVAAPWLGELRPIWRAAYGGDLPKGVADLWRGPVEEVGVEEFARRLANYVRQTEAAFVNVGKFATTHGAYADGAGDDGTATARRWLALLRRHDLLSFNGNREDYARRRDAARGDPEAPEGFDQVWSLLRPWEGLGGMEERFALKAIQDRLAGMERRAAA